jgi:hypothetical protein
LGNRVAIYRAAEYLSTISIDASLDASASLDPLELVFDAADQNLAILARHSSGSATQLRSYIVDISS